MAILFADISAFATPPNCPPPVRPGQTDSGPLSLQADKIEDKARAQNNELCAGSTAPASQEQQSKLLQLIRDRSMGRLSQLSSSGKKLDPATAAEKVSQMRLMMALRNARVEMSNSKLTVTPAIQFSHPGGFANLKTLTPAENSVIQTKFAESVNDYNELMPATAASAADKKRIYDLGTRLTGELHDQGQIGYNEIITQYPFLLFVSESPPSPSHILGAQERYATAVANERKQLAEIKDLSPEGPALALIFYGPVVSEILKENASFCGAFKSLREKASAKDSYKAWSTAGFGAAAGGTCMFAAAATAGTLGVGCLLMSGAELLVASHTAKRAYEEKQLLYGSALQGNLDEYAQRLEQANQYLAGAGLSALGVMGSAAGVVGRVAKAKVASEEPSTLTAITPTQASPSNPSTTVAPHHLKFDEKPVDSHTLILDSNIAISLRNQSTADRTDFRTRSLFVGQLMKKGKSDLRVTPRGSAEIVYTANDKRASIGFGRTKLDPAVSEADRQKITKTLEEYRVGANKGVADRQIIMEAMTSMTEANSVATFVTADKKIYNALARIANIDIEHLGGTTLPEAYANGFEVTIAGRRLRVIPVRLTSPGHK